MNVGIEYTLRVEPPDPERILPLLRRLPEAVPVNEGFDLGPFADGWATATVMLDPAGVYFCDYGRTGTHLGLLVAWLAGEFGSVTVTEL